MKPGHLLALIIIVLGVVLIVALLKGPELDEPSKVGPNPDGSYGTQAEPLVQVRGTMIKEGELTIFLVVDVGSGGKHLTQIVLPVIETIREGKKDED